MEISKLKLLVNAEPFGFGPTAAIATFFPYLRERFENMAYLGKEHTLDLQKDLSYEKIYDISTSPEEDIKKIFSQYDVFFTALDFELATLAKSVGLKVVIYDPLTWYWKQIPEIVRGCDLYIAQDFFGVKERLEKESLSFSSAATIVPAIVSQRRPRVSKKYVLINLGGLQNPLCSVEDVERYARMFIDLLKKVIPEEEQVLITTSNEVSKRLDHIDVGTFNRSKMYDILENTKYAFMTPGLGNIYDSAKFNIPTIWLPPANDSQGQQLDLLKRYNMTDGQIEWADFGKPIEYFDEQPIVLKKIKDVIYSVLDTKAIKEKVEQVCKDISTKENSSTSSLLDRFGTGGAEAVSLLVFKYCKEHE